MFLLQTPPSCHFVNFVVVFWEQEIFFPMEKMALGLLRNASWEAMFCAQGKTDDLGSAKMLGSTPGVDHRRSPLAHKVTVKPST